MKTEVGVGEERVTPAGGRYNWGGLVTPPQSDITRALIRQQRAERAKGIVAAPPMVPAQRVREVQHTAIDSLPDVPSMKKARAEMKQARRKMRSGQRQYGRGYYIPRDQLWAWIFIYLGLAFMSGAILAFMLFHFLSGAAGGSM